MHRPHVMSGGRYPVLRSLAIIYVIGAALAAVGAIIAAGYALVGTRFAAADRVIIALGALAAGFLLVVSMLAVAELLKLFIDMEHNTRMMGAGRIGTSAGTTADAARGEGAHVNRIDDLDEETAEAALIRGH